MTLKEKYLGKFGTLFLNYQKSALKTAPPISDLQYYYSVIKTLEELDELKDAYKNNDMQNIIEELGDLFWYFSYLLKIKYPEMNIAENLSSQYPVMGKELTDETNAEMLKHLLIIGTSGTFMNSFNSLREISLTFLISLNVTIVHKKPLDMGLYNYFMESYLGFLKLCVGYFIGKSKFDYIIKSSSYWNKAYFDSIGYILNANIKKLRDRHGESYNQEFYDKRHEAEDEYISRSCRKNIERKVLP